MLITISSWWYLLNKEGYRVMSPLLDIFTIFSWCHLMNTEGYILQKGSWSQSTARYRSLQGRHGLISVNINSWCHLLNTEGYIVVLRSTRFDITLYNLMMSSLETYGYRLFLWSPRFGITLYILMMPSLEFRRLQSSFAVDTVWYHPLKSQDAISWNIRLQFVSIVATVWYHPL